LSDPARVRVRPARAAPARRARGIRGDGHRQLPARQPGVRDPDGRGRNLGPSRGEAARATPRAAGPAARRRRPVAWARGAGAGGGGGVGGGAVDRDRREAGRGGAAVIPVVHVITRLTLGGSAENTVSTIEGLARRGYTSTLALGPESDAATVAEARRRGCRI